MAHFAELDKNNIVLRVNVINNKDTEDENGNEIESIGSAFCNSLWGGRWIQTSYNSKIRNVFAGIGMEYIPDLDIFRSKQPYQSWSWSIEENQWEPPVPYPFDDLMHQWNEDIKNWEALTFEVTD